MQQTVEFIQTISLKHAWLVSFENKSFRNHSRPIN